jgi:hypothetical protein
MGLVCRLAPRGDYVRTAKNEVVGRIVRRSTGRHDQEARIVPGGCVSFNVAAGAAAIKRLHSKSRSARNTAFV